MNFRSEVALSFQISFDTCVLICMDIPQILYGVFFVSIFCLRPQTTQRAKHAAAMAAPSKEIRERKRILKNQLKDNYHIMNDHGRVAKNNVT